MGIRVLVIDDEPDLVELLNFTLRQAGFEVESAASGAAGLRAIEAQLPDLLVLDLMLPDLSGGEVCRRLRAAPSTRELPILMLTARSEEIDRVVGFELGADDYVAKPFSPRELVLRVRAILRRRKSASESAGAEGLQRHGVLELDRARHQCRVAGEPVALTAKEFRLLGVLMTAAGRVLTRKQLLDAVWGDDVVVTTRTVDAHLARLREKLGRAADLIETVRGVGYRFGKRGG